MPDILVVKTNMFLRAKELNEFRNYIMAQKETGVIILPPYCDAQVIPDGVEIKIEDCTKGGNYEDANLCR